MTLEQSAKLVLDDGEDTEIESDCDVDDSRRTSWRLLQETPVGC